MSRPLDFSDDNLPVRWQYVKRNLREMGVLDDRYDDFERAVRRSIKNILQESIDAEFSEQVGARPYERTAERRATRKGRYTRMLTTTYGLSELAVPRARGGRPINYAFFDKYQRRQKKFDEMVILAMILGLSTRKQSRLFKAFIGDSVSHATASRILATLDDEIRSYRSRQLRDEYEYLLVDGIWVSVRGSGGEVKRRPVLVCMGITTERSKHVIALKLARSENEAEVTAFLNDLWRRGLKGERLKLVASDGAGGIRAALNMVYPYAAWQFCTTHKLRDVAAHVRHKKVNRKKLTEEVSEIYRASTLAEALKRYEGFCSKWQAEEPSAVRCLKRDFNNTLSFYEHLRDRNFISTTNHLERELEEIRRRIKIQGYFKSRASVDYWVFGIVKYRGLLPQPEGMPYTLQKELKLESAHNP